MVSQFFISLKRVTTILFVLHLNRQTNVFKVIFIDQIINQLSHLFITLLNGRKQRAVLQNCQTYAIGDLAQSQPQSHCERKFSSNQLPFVE